VTAASAAAARRRGTATDGGDDRDRTPVRADPTESGRAVATLVQSFVADPVMRYWMPGADAYLEHFPGIVRAFGGRAFEHGTALAAREFGGVALWLPPGVAPDDDALLAAFARAAPPARVARVYEVSERMDGFHIDEPHWYLPLIGVDAAHHGRGLGTALLALVLGRCDEDGVPAYLESTNPRNLPLYTRLGFETLGAIEVADVPPLVPMLRRPRR
jgi:GNAT superfamily N-acetyltransferase